MNLNRYARQIILPEIGAEGQSNLAKSSILCVGVGGLGSPATLYLAAAGVGTIGIIDPDRVDTSNLQRQILFENSDQSDYKVEAARRRLLKINPEIKIEAFQEALNAENALSLLSRFHMVLDGSDNFETKFLINDACTKLEIPMIYGAVNRFEGQVALFHSKYGSCYRCLYPSQPKAPIRNCAETGVLGAVVGTIGTLQATLALNYLISGGDSKHPLFPTIGELTLFDLGGKWNIHSVQIPKNPKCPICSLPLEEIELQSLPPVCTVDQTTLQKTDNASLGKILLIDVRELEEWHTGHIANAIHWPLSKLVKGELPSIENKHAEIVTYCQSGKRSMQAAQILDAAGFTSVRSLIGGIQAWNNPLKDTK